VEAENQKLRLQLKVRPAVKEASALQPPALQPPPHSSLAFLTSSRARSLSLSLALSLSRSLARSLSLSLSFSLSLLLKVGKDAATQDDLEKIRICEELEKMVKQKATDEGEHKALEKGIMEKILHYKERHADYGRYCTVINQCIQYSSG
jgi:hypothetical protein